MKLYVISPVRNERTGWLPSYLEAWSEIADHILLADNGSTDGTREYFREWDKVTDITPPFGSKEPMFGNEAAWRKHNYLKAFSLSEKGDVLCWADVDMVPVEDPRIFFDLDHDGVWTSVLYDLWTKRDDGTLMYRDDDWWKGHHTKRIWAVRNCDVVEEAGAEWIERGMHCQHLAKSLFEAVHAGEIPVMKGPELLHYGWFGEENRQRKFKIYRSLAERGHLTEFEWAHAKTALDDDPNLEPLPRQPRWEMEQNKKVEVSCE